jgi:hypothetical protein
MKMAMRQHKILVGVVLLAGALFALRAPAFWSAALYQIHQDITQDVLNGQFSFGGEDNYTFSDTAVTAINAMHKIQDSGNYDPLDHFDGEHLADGFARLQNTRGMLEDELKSTSPDSQKLWIYVGVMLHQMQDFYSHSTYTQSAAGSIPVDFATLTDPSQSPTIPSFFASPTYPADNPQDCAADFITLLPVVASSGLITTGFYQAANPDPGKCNHGLFGDNAVGVPKTVIVGALCQFGVKTPADGIARDHPCSSVESEVTDFEVARSLAMQETQMFITAIIKELDTANNSAGFCALLGLDETATACQPKTPSGACASTNSCVMWNVDTVSYQADPCLGPNGPEVPCFLLDLEANASSDANGPINYIQFQFPTAMVGVPVENFTSNLTAGVQVTSAPITLQFTSNDPFSTDPSMSESLVGFVTKQVNPSPPASYPVNALQSSAAYLQNNSGAAPGTVTFTITSQPTPDATTCTSICTGANLIFSGSFDFYIDDPQIFYTEKLQLGAHHVTGTFTFLEATCQVTAGSPGLQCGTGAH